MLDSSVLIELPVYRTILLLSTMDNPVNSSYKIDIVFIPYSILWDIFLSSDLVNIAVAVIVVHSN